MKLKESAVDDPEIITRTRDNLDDYLYEPYTKFSNADAGKVFLLLIIL